MAFTLSQREVEFTEAANSWNLEKLYADLAIAKGKGLTPVEKKFLRGLLCGYSPAEIADRVYRSRNSNAVRVYLSNGLYKYIEELLIRKTNNLIKVKSWSRVIQLLDRAGYKTDSVQEFNIKNLLQDSTQQVTEFVLTENKQQDWGEAVDISIFYGRTEELATLERWLVKDRCRLVAILGMGGIGKTALSISIAEQIQDKFDYVIWRSLHHAPPVQALLANLIQFLSNQEIDLPETVTDRISQLIDYLRCSRCLLVLDNVESILGSGKYVGHYREGYEGYGELLRRVGETLHQSAVVLTSREKPREFVALEGDKLPVRSLQLEGILPAEAQKIVQTKGNFSGSEAEWLALIEYYAGNPQMLKIAATAIQALFQGDIAQFLKRDSFVFGEIRALLERQFHRLSELEKRVMYWLAINRGSVSLPELRGFATPVSESVLLEALESLIQRSLVDKNLASFTQKQTVVEYVTKRLTELDFERAGRSN